MSPAPSVSDQNVYGITYATLDEGGIRFESELAIQLTDGRLTTLKMPTQASEREAIQQLLCDRQPC